MMDPTDTHRGHGPRTLLLALQRVLLVALVTALISVVVAGGLALMYQAAYARRYYEGVSICGVQIGGLTRNEARELLEQRLAPAEAPYAALQAPSAVWTLSLSALGGSFDLAPALDEAWRIGRVGTWQERIVAQARALWYGYDAVPPLTISHGLSLEPLRRIARQVAQPATSADVRLVGLYVAARGPKTGRELDIAATRDAIERAVSGALGPSRWGTEPRLLASAVWGPDSGPLMLPKPVPVPLAFKDVAPSLSEVTEAQAHLDALLASPLILQMDTQELDPAGHLRSVQRRWALDQATLASWATITVVDSPTGPRLSVGLDQVKVDAFLSELADAVARPPREGRFLYDPSAQEIRVMSPGQMGLALDVAGARTAILGACFSPDRTVKLPIHQATPLVTADELRSMLPLDLISVGKSSFAGSTPNRAQNIRIAASRFHGVVVPPAAEFSFLHYLGPVNASTGYAESWIIFGDRTLLGAGGGVCQVSTTCFRAAFWGGYPITARSAHAYRVSWYEPPLGLDAAVFAPTTDMRFRNDDTWPLLIMTSIDEETSTLTFAFYGRSRNRQVTIEGPTIEQRHQAEDPVEEVDPSLAPGTRILVERAREGLDVRVVRIVEEAGKVVSRDEFWSHYQAWPARYRVGPPRDTTEP